MRSAETYRGFRKNAVKVAGRVWSSIFQQAGDINYGKAGKALRRQMTRPSTPPPMDAVNKAVKADIEAGQLATIRQEPTPKPSGLRRL